MVIIPDLMCGRIAFSKFCNLECCFSPKASDGSSSREDLSSQLFRRNEQIRKLEVKLSGKCPDTYKTCYFRKCFPLNLHSLIRKKHMGLGSFEKIVL